MGAISKFWNKTVFSDIIKERRERKEEEKKLRQEALAEAHDELITLKKGKIIEDEKQKIMGNTKGKKFLQQLSTEFKGSDLGSTDKLNRMLGKQSNIQTGQIYNTNNILSNEKLSQYAGGRVPTGDDIPKVEAPPLDNMEIIRTINGKRQKIRVYKIDEEENNMRGKI